MRKGRVNVIILSSTNAYLGAWVTAGFAVGGVVFAGIQSIASAVSKYFVAKTTSNNQLMAEKERLKQQELKIEHEKEAAIKSTFQNYYAQTSLSIYKKQMLDEQVKAYSRLIAYLPDSDIGFNSKIWEIQESLSSGGYTTSADKKFHLYLPKLKELEKQLLSQSEGHLPKEHTDDSEDLLSVQDSLQKQTKPKETKE